MVYTLHALISLTILTGKGIASFSPAFIATLETIFNGIASGLTGTIAFEGFNCFQNAPALPASTPGWVSPFLYALGIVIEFIATAVTVSGIVKDVNEAAALELELDEEIAAESNDALGESADTVSDINSTPTPNSAESNSTAARSSGVSLEVEDVEGGEAGGRISASDVRRTSKRISTHQHSMTHMARTPSIASLAVHAVTVAVAKRVN